jgi:hypothetical protein
MCYGQLHTRQLNYNTIFILQLICCTIGALLSLLRDIVKVIYVAGYMHYSACYGPRFSMYTLISIDNNMINVLQGYGHHVANVR